MAQGTTECSFWPLVTTLSILCWPALTIVLLTRPTSTWLAAMWTESPLGTHPWRRRSRRRSLELEWRGGDLEGGAGGYVVLEQT